jgi:methylisocitrate lyase
VTPGTHLQAQTGYDLLNIEDDGNRHELRPGVVTGAAVDAIFSATHSKREVTMPSMSAKCQVFRQLHQSGCFVIPNPWDLGSASLLAGLGFPALATTSSGFAWSRGRQDNHVSLEETLLQLRSIAEAVAVPVNADFEGGFAIMPAEVAANVALAAATGVAGLSIEDSAGDPLQPLFDFTLSVERIRSARRAIDESGTGILLTGRSEGFIVGRPDLAETIRRLAAYAEAGADCLYAPGIRTRADITAIVNAVAPKPVNMLVGGDFTTVAELAGAGVRRISVGGALARAAWSGFLDAAKEIAEHGTFGNLSRAIPFADIDRSFAAK